MTPVQKTASEYKAEALTLQEMILREARRLTPSDLRNLLTRMNQLSMLAGMEDIAARVRSSLAHEAPGIVDGIYEAELASLVVKEEHKHYYVVTDVRDPGAEFDTYEEAREYLRVVQKHSPDAIIL